MLNPGSTSLDSFIDLSHTIKNGMPVYPGTPPVGISSIGDIIHDGYRELELNICTHTGTHMDSPSHILPEGKTLDQFHISKFCGSGIVLEHTKKVPLTCKRLESISETLQETSFVLIKTNWSKFWGKQQYFKDYPLPDSDVFKQLSRYSPQGIGIDTISVDGVGNTRLPNHHTLLENDIVIIENLTNLDALVTKPFKFFCFPLFISNSDGSPIRATAQFID